MWRFYKCVDACEIPTAGAITEKYGYSTHPTGKIVTPLTIAQMFFCCC